MDTLVHSPFLDEESSIHSLLDYDNIREETVILSIVIGFCLTRVRTRHLHVKKLQTHVILFYRKEKPNSFPSSNTKTLCFVSCYNKTRRNPFVLFFSLTSIASTMANKEMDIARGVDLKRYMGRWYEIACFPSRFQPSDGKNTRATYTLRDDGTVNVLNETWSGGKRSYIEGTAYKADPNSDQAKLKVKFYVPPMLPIIPVTGDYWVLHLDHDYHYALIGQPSRNYLWVCVLLFQFS